jgi:hypothetical protein
MPIPSTSSSTETLPSPSQSPAQELCARAPEAIRSSKPAQSQVIGRPSGLAKSRRLVIFIAGRRVIRIFPMRR